MFKWLNKQGVESDDGFIVQVVSRFVIEYLENTRKITINFEVENAASSNVTISVNKSSFSFWDNGDVIQKNQKNIIINNFIEAMKFQSIGVIMKD